MPRTIGIIIVGKNVGNFAILTLNEILIAIKLVNNSNIIYSVIYVDDQSSDGTLVNFSEIVITNEMYNQDNIKVIAIPNKNNPGFAGSIKSGSELIDFDNNVLILPGNHQLPAESIAILIRNSIHFGCVIGWRKNKKEARPFAKVVSSNILQKFTAKFLFPSLVEITGTWSVPNYIIQKYLPAKAGHGFGFYLLYGSLMENERIIQVPTMLLTDYKKRTNLYAFKKTPKLQNIGEIVYAFTLIGFKMRTSKKLVKHKSRTIESGDGFVSR